MASSKGKIIVIGAGITGLASAYYLIRNGWEVRVLDKGDLTDNCSYGNAGMIVPSHFVPMAAPGIISSGIKWMFDSRSPFYIKPTPDLSLVSWGLKFVKSATAENVARASPCLRDYHLLSKSLFEAMASEQGFDFGLESKGILVLYKTEKAGEEEVHLAAEARKLGLDAAVLSEQGVQELEPDLSVSVAGGIHYRCDAHFYPQALMAQLTNFVLRNGGQILGNCAVSGFETGHGEIRRVLTEKGAFEADLVVMTGGAWLPELARKAGMSIPLMPGKGYSFQADNARKTIRYPALLSEARVAVTPMNGLVRFGGTMEIAPVNGAINRRRLEGIVNAIPKYYPDLKIQVPEPESTWFGFRPCSADGLPYLGRSRKVGNLIVAGGHGMMGMSLGPATGWLVSELAEGVTPSVDISLYDPQRF